MKIKSFLMLFVTVLTGVTIFVSCGKDEVDPVECSVSPTEIVLTSEKGAASSFGITFTNGEGQWEVTKSPDFVTVYPKSGKGSGTIRVETNADNNSRNPKDGDIIIEITGADIKSQTIHVVQQSLEECYVEPTNILQLCDGLAFNWQFGRNVKYYYWDIFKQTEINKMSDNEIIKKLVTGEIEDRVVPDNDDYACFYNLNENTQYVVITVSYAEGDRQGEMVKTPLTTKSSKNQPEATINDMTYFTAQDNKVYYEWNVIKNTYCREYYTYAAASPEYFATLYYLVEGAYPMVAWAIKNEIQKNGEDHTTSINDGYIYMPFDNGRDKFWGAQVENGKTRFMAFPATDNYFCVLTWGTNSSGELSGLLNSVAYDLSDDGTEEKHQKLMSRRKSTGVPKKFMMNAKSLKLVRINN